MEKLSKWILMMIAASALAACSYTSQEQARYDEMRAYWEANNGKTGVGFGAGSGTALSR